jgi:hypothetical protein
VIRQVLFIVALLATAVAVAEPKVSGGGTPPAGGNSTAQPAPPDKPATSAADREAARKALDALKGGKAQDKRGQDERKPGGR